MTTPHPTPPSSTTSIVPPSSGDGRPLLVIICGELTPYRVHWHRRIVREIPGVRLTTLHFPFRWQTPWSLGYPEGIGLIRFQPRRPTIAPPPAKIPWQTRVRILLAEWAETGRVLRWLWRERPAAVLCMGYYAPPYLQAIVLRKLVGRPVMVWADSNIHGDRFRGVRAALKRVGLRVVLRMCDIMFACGRFGREFFAKYSRRPGRVFIAPYEPDYDQIAATPRTLVDEVRERFHLDPKRRRFVAVNRLVRAKRVDTVIDAFLRVAGDRPEWDLVIAGQGDQREALEGRVPPELRHRVLWAGFIGEQSVVNALYRNCDVLVLASEYEPWALVVNEAAAGGLAIISSDVVGAAAELVRDGVNGRLFPAGNVDALTHAMRDVSDPKKLDAMKAASARVVADWRREGDPVEGLRQALMLLGLAGAARRPESDEPAPVDADFSPAQQRASGVTEIDQ